MLFVYWTRLCLKNIYIVVHGHLYTCVVLMLHPTLTAIKPVKRSQSCSATDSLTVLVLLNVAPAIKVYTPCHLCMYNILQNTSQDITTNSLHFTFLILFALNPDWSCKKLSSCSKWHHWAGSSHLHCFPHVDHASPVQSVQSCSISSRRFHPSEG